MDGFRNYDAWKLRTPEEDAGYVDYEVFRSYCGDFYSCDELEIERFDKDANEEIESNMESYNDMEDLIESVAEQYNIFTSEEEAIAAYTEQLEQDHLDALEAKAEARFEAKRDGD